MSGGTEFVDGQNLWMDRTCGWTQLVDGQNIYRDRACGVTEHLEDRMSGGKDRQEGQNFSREKTFGGQNF